MLVDKIKVLCEKRGLTLAELERKLELSNGSIRRWDTNLPSIDKLKKVSEYFCVTIDELVSQEDTSALDLDIRKIERARSHMPAAEKEKMMKILEVSFEEYFNEE
jgi:transcriptional regulator with XRE-family HTH domain